MRWFFGLNCPLGSRRKGPRSIFYLAQKQVSWAEFSSFGALGECAYFHSAPSPTTHIFSPRLLLQRLFSFPAFSYGAYFHSPPSPIALIFISRILLIRLFSLCKYRTGIIVYIEYQNVCPFVWIGPPHPLHRKQKWLHPWPLGPKWGGTHSLPGEGVGGPEGTESLVLYVYYNPFTVNIPILYKPVFTQVEPFPLPC